MPKQVSNKRLAKELRRIINEVEELADDRLDMQTRYKKFYEVKDDLEIVIAHLEISNVVKKD